MGEVVPLLARNYKQQNKHRESQTLSFLMSLSIRSSRMSPSVVPRGARASGSSGLEAGCSVWLQSYSDAFEPEGRRWDRWGAEHRHLLNQLPTLKKLFLPMLTGYPPPKPHLCPWPFRHPLPASHALAHQKQSQLPSSICTHVLPCREKVLKHRPPVWVFTPFLGSSQPLLPQHSLPTLQGNSGPCSAW